MRPHTPHALPARAGLGFKPGHFHALSTTTPDLGFVEVHAENYLVDGGPLHHQLGWLRERHALSVHGVGLSIGGPEPLDDEHLGRLARLLERCQPQSFSEHLAWSGHGGVFFNDLLPLPYDRTTLQQVCAHVDQVQDRLQRRLLLENPATCVEFDRSTMDEGDFITEVLRRTGCGLLLDVSNLHVACVNHHRDVHAALRALPLHAVGEIHLAGFSQARDSLGERLLIDSHGAAVADEVWALYQEALTLTGPVATLIERDHDVPALAVLLAEAARADRALQAAAAERGVPA
ncbi:hypothetical protein C7444_10832 [Sphaerotilus hippei]|uniref:UPF0276 protein C7444_10832 n=1 Tax=Sphaerotilus hippei TaxID=744406 RepID=A0A318GZQ9_9BURK|nr:DUF692 domain-containing protein [Sphaerotilus hippei]PXW95774.1 hypothetical protein C7444_10832 [Sphaerotilus hippei]